VQQQQSPQTASGATAILCTYVPGRNILVDMGFVQKVPGEVFPKIGPKMIKQNIMALNRLFCCCVVHIDLTLAA
jgi:hypothetical protein